MNEMIDRVALVLCKSDDDCRCAGSGGTSSICHVVEFKDVARAVVAAMREPTKTMVLAGKSQDSEWDDTHADCEMHWMVMIDEALK